VAIARRFAGTGAEPGPLSLLTVSGRGGATVVELGLAVPVAAVALAMAIRGIRDAGPPPRLSNTDSHRHGEVDPSSPRKAQSMQAVVAGANATDPFPPCAARFA
jgi:hypothetical protein